MTTIKNQMVYHKHGLTLSPLQIKSLASGKTVRLKHSNLVGPHQVHLTLTQLKKLKKAHEAKKGSDLKLSSAQLAHHRRVGGSIFDDIWSGLKSAGEFAYNKILKPVGTKVLEDVIVPRASAKASDIASSFLTKQGLGVKKPRKARAKKVATALPLTTDINGGNVFDDIWSGIKSTGEFLGDKVLPKVIDVGIPLAARALTGVGTKRRPGRPRKVKPEEILGQSITLQGERVGRGRKKKVLAGSINAPGYP